MKKHSQSIYLIWQKKLVYEPGTYLSIPYIHGFGWYCAHAFEFNAFCTVGRLKKNSMIDFKNVFLVELSKTCFDTCIKNTDERVVLNNIYDVIFWMGHILLYCILWHTCISSVKNIKKIILHIRCLNFLFSIHVNKIHVNVYEFHKWCFLIPMIT